MTGRPTDYKEEYSHQAEEFLETCQDTYDSETRQWTVNLPSIDKFSDHLGFHRDTLYKWAEDFPEFSDTLDKIRKAQKNKLMDSGLAGTYNSTIAKLLLNSNHNVIEKSQQQLDHTSQGDKINVIDIMNLKFATKPEPETTKTNPSDTE